MDNEATVWEIKPHIEAHHPVTCDFCIVTCHPFHASWDRGVWAERQGKQGGRGAIVGTHTPAIV